MVGSIIAQTEDYVITFDSSLRILILAYQEPLISSEFRKSINHLLKEAKPINIKFGNIGFIADTRKLGNNISLEDLDWVATCFLPSMVENGFRVASMVIPEDIYARQKFKKLIAKTQSYKKSNNIIAEEFRDIESALMFVITQLEELEASK
jgi:hypothetical protein